MAATYEPVYSTTLTGNQSSVTLNSFSGYTDLVIVVNAFSASLDNLAFQLNGDTGTNYSYTTLWGNGSSKNSSRGSNTNNPYLNYYAAFESSFPAPVIINLQNYSNTTTYKSILARGANASRGVDATVALWRSTSAITSILLKCHDGANFVTGSVFFFFFLLAA